MNGIDGYYSSPDFVCTILLLDRKICFFEITDIYIYVSFRLIIAMTLFIYFFLIDRHNFIVAI